VRQVTRSQVRGGKLITKDPRVANILRLYNLCSKFKALPSEVMTENDRIMSLFQIIMDEKGKVQGQKAKKAEREARRSG